MLRNRLWLRLWLTSALILAVAVVTAAFVAQQSTTRAFASFVAHGNSLQRQRVQQLLGRYFEVRGSWDGVGPLLESVRPPGNGPLLLFDPADRLIAGVDANGQSVTPREWPGPPADDDPRPNQDGPLALLDALDLAGDPPAVIPILGPGEALVGRVQLPATAGPALFRDRRNAEFVTTITRSLIVGALGGGLVALVVSLLLSRRIVAPIEALTVAARRLGAGDLKQRVAVEGFAEIGELSRAFNGMAEDLARDQEIRQHLVADVAHELRTPLANVCGYLEALRDGVIDPRPEVIASIHDEADLLKRLVEDLQELSLAEAGQLRLHPTAADVPTLIDRAVAAATVAAVSKGIDLSGHAEPDLPAVWVDESRTAQVLRNLLANALTHTPAGGQVAVSARRAGDGVAVSVADTGPGIAPFDLALIFERFYRTDHSRARATGGVGLGLTITRHLVQAQGGTIAASSPPGQGATFTFILPVAPAASPGRDAPAAPRPAIASAR